MVDMHEGTETVKETKLDVLQIQLDKFKVKDGEGVTEMYSRLALIINVIVGLGSRREESPPRESREDRYERRPSRRSKDSKRKDKSSKIYTMQIHQAHVGEWVPGSNSYNYSERSYHSDSDYT